MNRSALKLPCAVLFGVVMGCAIGRPPWWGGGVDAESGRLQAMTVQSGLEVERHGRLAAPAVEAGTGREDGKLGLKRLEAMAAKFRNVWQKGNITAEVSVMTGAGRLSAEEFGPLMALLEAEKTGATFSKGDNASRELIKLLTRCWTMVDSKAALSFAMERPEFKADEGLMVSIVGELAKTDLQAAKAAVGRLDRGGREAGGREVVRILVQKDIRAALGYARELADAQAETGVLQQMAVTDPLGAAAELAPGGDSRLGAVGSIAKSLLAKDRAAFEAWAGSLNDPAQRSMALSVALNKDADLDPRSAAVGMAAWLAGDTEAAGHAGDLAAELATKWVESGGKSAEVAAWALTLPEGSARNMAVQEAGKRWLDQDIMAASAWLRSVPQGQGKDNVVLQLVRKISGDTPADAFEWAGTVEIPTLRNDALMQAVWNWAKQDPAAAEQALETLPAKDRVYMRDVFETAKKEREKAAEGK